MGQIKHKMGNVGGGVDISHKSKMSGKAKSLMSFPGGMPGPGDYGKAEGVPRVVGRGMAKFISGESVGMRKMGQHKAPPKTEDPKNQTEKYEEKNSTDGIKTERLTNVEVKPKSKFDRMSPEEKAAFLAKRKREQEYNKLKKEKGVNMPQNESTFKRSEELRAKNNGPTNTGNVKKKKRKALRTISTVTGKILSSRDKKEIGTQYSGGAKKSAGPMDPSKKDSKLKKGAVVSGDKSKVSKKVTGMTAEEKKAELLYRRNLKKAINKSKRDTQKDVRANLTQVQKDRQANLKVQRQRQKAGQDYVKYKKGTSTTAKGHSDEKGKKTGFEGGGGSNEGVVVRKKLKK